jgi:hypothetical protein
MIAWGSFALGIIVASASAGLILSAVDGHFDAAIAAIRERFGK